jgi:hypothetical protein
MVNKKRFSFPASRVGLLCLGTIALLTPPAAPVQAQSLDELALEELINGGSIEIPVIPMQTTDYTSQISQAANLLNGGTSLDQAASYLASSTNIDLGTATSALSAYTSGDLVPSSISDAINMAQQGYSSTASSIFNLAASGQSALANNAITQAISGYGSTVSDYIADASGFLNVGNLDGLSAITDFSSLNLSGIDLPNISMPGIDLGGITGQLDGVRDLYNNISSQFGGIYDSQIGSLIQDVASGDLSAGALSGALNLLNVDPGGIGGQALNLLQSGAGGDYEALISQLGGMAGVGGVFSGDAVGLLSGALSGNIDISSALNIGEQLAGGLLPPGAGELLSGALDTISGLNIDLSDPMAALAQLGDIPDVQNLLNSLSSSLGFDLSNPEAAVAALTNSFGILAGGLGIDISNLDPAQFTSLIGNLGIPSVDGLISGLGGLGAFQDILSSGNILSFAGPGGIAAGVLGNFGVGLDTFGISFGGFGGSDPCCITAHINMHMKTMQNFTQQLEATKNWISTTFIQQNIIPAMQRMTEQLNVVAMQQVSMIGMLLDAKHQLETQRLLQQLQAEAHKDYHPSEGMCVIGTNVRSLAESEHFADYNTQVIAKRTMQRQLLSGDVASRLGPDSDVRSRRDQFIKVYCDPNDNNHDLRLLCLNQDRSGPIRKNKDIDFTRTIETQLTLDVDFSAGSEGNTQETPDEEDIFALASNLYANQPLPRLNSEKLSNLEVVREKGDGVILDFRSIAAKRSVAQNSFAAITGMRTAGSPESATPSSAAYMYQLMYDLGLSEDEVTEMIGTRPSYFAQMEVLTKKLYQNPNFYTELYDKPANVERKAAALQAIGLMQDRDIYRSLLRSEAVLSVLLETKLSKQQEILSSKFPSAGTSGGAQQGQ